MDQIEDYEFVCPCRAKIFQGAEGGHFQEEPGQLVKYTCSYCFNPLPKLVGTGSSRTFLLLTIFTYHTHQVELSELEVKHAKVNWTSFLFHM